MLSRPFMTVKEIADLLKIGEVTVRHWIRDGALRAFDVGREWRIAPSDLEAFLARHATIPIEGYDGGGRPARDGGGMKGGAS